MTLSIRLLLRTIATFTVAMSFMALMLTSWQAEAFITDGDGNVTRIERNGVGQATAIVSPDGQRTILSQDGLGYLSSVTNPAGESTRMSYTASGLLTAYTNPRGQASLISYDTNGRLIRDQNAAGGAWNLSRSGGNSNYTVSMSSALGRQTRYGVEIVGNGDTLRTTTQPDGSVNIALEKVDGSSQTTFANGMVSSSSSQLDPRFGQQAPYTRAASLRMPSGLTLNSSASRSAALGNPTDLLSLTNQTDSITVNGKTSSTQFEAALKRLTSTSAMGRQSVTQIDSQGRPLEESNGNLLPIRYSYDSRGRLTAVSQGDSATTGNPATPPRRISYQYNPAGYLGSVTDAQGRVTGYRYDAVGRVTGLTLPDGRIVNFSFDANGNLVSLTPPGRPAHGFEYNAVDQATGNTPPVLMAGQATATRFSYNLDKQLTQVTRPDGGTLTYSYDSGGRLSSVSSGGSAGGSGGAISYQYAPNQSQLTGISTADGVSLSYSYDGALLTQSRLSGGVGGGGGTNSLLSGTLDTRYNNDFRVTRLSLTAGAGTGGGTPPAPVNTDYSYDDDGLITQAGALAISRDAANGLPVASSLGQITTQTTYTAFGERAGVTVSQGSNLLFSETYQRDSVGRIIRKTTTLGGLAGGAGATNQLDYRYDANGQLIEVSQNGVRIGAYQYDANGNRTVVEDSGDGSGTSSSTANYDDQDRLVSVVEAGSSRQYTYRASGELQQISEGGGGGGSAGTSSQYTYDDFGNLKQVTLADGRVIDYVVDGRNRRIGKRVNGALVQGFLYQDQLKPIAELDGAGNLVATYIYADNINVPEYLEKGGNRYRLVTDPLGSVRLVINSATGEVAQRIDYDAWGKVTSDSNPGFQPFGFAGGLYDRDTGFTRFGARDYDARIGRWTAKDPIGFAGGDTGLYNYAGNDPVNFVDPEGEFGIPGAIAGGLIGAVSGYLGASANGGNKLVGALIGGLGGALVGGLGPLIGPTLLGQASVRAAAGGLGNILGQGQKVGDPCFSGFKIGSIFGSAIGGALSGLVSPGSFATSFSGSLGVQVTQRAIAGIPGSAASLTSGILGNALSNAGQDPKCECKKSS